MTLLRPGDAACLRQWLAEEAAAVSRFVVLLQREQNQLSQGETGELPALAEQKAGLAATLQRLAEQRNAWLAAQNHPADRVGLESWLDQHPAATDVAVHWEKIITLAAEARELNRLNGELIDLHLRHNALTLHALRGGRDSLDLYGTDGQSRVAGGGRINASA